MTGYHLVLCLSFLYQLREYEEQISFPKLIIKSASEPTKSYSYIQEKNIKFSEDLSWVKIKTQPIISQYKEYLSCSALVSELPCAE